MVVSSQCAGYRLGRVWRSLMSALPFMIIGCGTLEGLQPAASSIPAAVSASPAPVAGDPAPAALAADEPAEPVDPAELLKGPIEPGARGPAVLALQKMLNDAGFYRGELDGIYGGQTRSAVIALHKALDMPRTGAWRGRELEELQYYAGPGLPARPGQTDRVEIDLDRQLMYLVKGGRVVSTIPISSGNGKPYKSQSGKRVKAKTPEGNFTLYRRYRGLRKSYLGELYWPWYFSGGYALHGSRRVPPTPASHGCVRVPMWDADYLNNELSIGMPFHVWRSS